MQKLARNLRQSMNIFQFMPVKINVSRYIFISDFYLSFFYTELMNHHLNNGFFESVFPQRKVRLSKH